MKPHHFAHQAIDGLWHTVCRAPDCGSLQSVAESPCKDAAEDEAERLNAAAASADAGQLESLR
ncbi:hypothetical protein [Roseateles saccharophilus]|uniref:Uncharacterized protein n=1 Tax=Roseateles saccharophilus TaxID=304 RepID=A0A4V2VPM8_ROSSA|nr:hypothetical protein [Roseateles saccharophilus]MDG0834180.1 hypothetical protein [Roseateles saccharophilus]TCU91299.1 hypothetical protein EV671_102614 [Roseateles saccharophilus]